MSTAPRPLLRPPRRIIVVASCLALLAGLVFAPAAVSESPQQSDTGRPPALVASAERPAAHQVAEANSPVGVTGISVNTSPAADPATGFSTDYGPVAVDYSSRKVTARFAESVVFDRLELVSSLPSTRITAANWSIWVSEDNTKFTEVSGWTLDQIADGARLRHVFTGFKARARYVKVTTNFTDAAFTFVLNKPMTDFLVTPAIPMRAMYIRPDWNPATGRASYLAERLGAGAFDTHATSYVIDFFGHRMQPEQIQVFAAVSTTRQDKEHYELYSSDNNLLYTPVQGWDLTSTVVNGRVVHTFTGINVSAKYFKIHSTFDAGAYNMKIDDAILDIRVTGKPEPVDDEGQLQVDSQRWITTDASFPDVDDPTKMNAQAPSIVRAGNGDILLAFNTSMDGNPGGIRMMRSTDNGVTWGSSSVFRNPEYFPAGAAVQARGFTALPDGTLLFHFGEAINHSRFNNREGVQFVARSTDNGHTWTGMDQPIQLPADLRQPFEPGAPIFRAASGVLLFPIWGVQRLHPDWEHESDASESGVLRSFDGGMTWSDYQVVGDDEFATPQFPPFTTTPMGMGSSEMSLQQLPGGRIVAWLRHDGVTDGKRWQQWRSYSDDDGATWSTPEPTDQFQAAGWVRPAPCSGFLTGGRTKFIYAGRDHDKTRMTFSYDNGVSWHGTVPLQGPPEYVGSQGALTGEPDYLPLDDSSFLVVWQVTRDSSGLIGPGEEAEPFRIYANVITDSAPADCDARADDVVALQNRTARFTIDRADRDDWSWVWAAKPADHPWNEPVVQVAKSEATALGCRSDQPLALRQKGSSTRLILGRSLLAAGVHRGDALELYNPTMKDQPVSVGYIDMDAYPTGRVLANFSRACRPSRLIFDFSGRSLGLDVAIRPGKAVQSISLTNLYGSSRLTANNYTVLSSPDNVTFTPANGWTMTKTVVDGHEVHTFSGLHITDRYVKIAQSTTNTAFTFVIDDPSNDIVVKQG